MVVAALNTYLLEGDFPRIRDVPATVLADRNSDGGAGVPSHIATTTWTYDQIANQLVSGYWGGNAHRFNVTQGGTITVNLTGLNSAGQMLAGAALGTWTDITGINFVQVTTGGQIVFDDNQAGAFADSVYSGGFITSSTINVSTQWLADYGIALGGYAFQTYIHEIGHALGLGHAGNYNETATYAVDALYQNDSWATTVMSYFSQTEAFYFGNQGFSEVFLVTPMLADIVAMSMMYGLSTSTRSGNTTYGFNSNAGIIYDATSTPHVGYTIFDTGGTDTLNFSQVQFYNQTLNLNPETFSSVNGRIGNLSIARGVVIENASGGTGNDIIIGNGANNVLAGGAGQDTVSYAAAASGVRVDLAITGQQNTFGAGLDTLTDFERLIGSSFDDFLIGAAGTFEILGGAGNDRLVSAGPGQHVLSGEDGNDVILPGPGDDWISGGDGFDTVDYSLAGGPITAGTNISNNITGSSGYDSISFVEKIVGTDFNDTLWAFQIGDQVWGGSGDDTLKGSGFGASELHGGLGNDTYEMWNSANLLFENAGEGVDTVIVRSSYTLASNFENLTLYQLYDPYASSTVYLNFNGTGNALANVIIGNTGANVLTGLGGADTLTGGNGHDIFRDTAAGLNGDTIADFGGNDAIVISDANLATFAFSLSGNTLTYTGGTLTLSAAIPSDGTIVASAASGGGVQLTIEGATPPFAGFGILRWAVDGFGYNAGNWTSNNISPRYVADVNGDGRADVVAFGSDGVTVVMSFDNGGFGGWTLVSPHFGSHTTAGGWTSNQVYPRLLADVNGDGRDDIIAFGEGGTYVSLSTSAIFGSPSFASPMVATGEFGRSAPAGGWMGNDRYPRVLGDVNGDGRADIVGFGNDGVYVALANPDGTFAASHMASFNFGFLGGAGGWSSQDRYPRRLADVNGDGRADIVAFGEGATYVAFGQANGTFGPAMVATGEFGRSTAAGGWTSDDVYHRELADVNGDGRADIIGFGQSAVYLALGHPDGTFGPSQPVYGEFGSGPEAGGWGSQDVFPRQVLDFDNDGDADLFGFGANGVYVTLSNGNIWL